MDSDKIEHLKLIQNIISRMAGNSSLIKRWAMVLVPVVVAFGKFGDAPIVAAIAGCIPLIFMWWQDAKYLRLEREYRRLYEAIVAGKDVKMFDLNPKPYLDRVSSDCKTACSWSVALFYFPLIITLIVVLAVLAFSA